jgi:hypothetical protein
MNYRQLIMIICVLLALPVALSAQDDDGQEVAEAQPEYGLSAEEIEIIEIPDYEQLEVESSLLTDRWYMRANGAINVHDAPNGAFLYTVDEGFNFLTALQRQDGWVEINHGEWVSEANVTSSGGVVSNFTGIFIPEDGLEITPAWLLVNAYPSSEPGGDPVESNGLLYRYTQVHIYDTVEIDGWNWYQIGAGKWIYQTHLAKVVPVERPDDVTTEKWVSINLYEQIVIAYEGDEPIFATLTSTGLPRWPTYEGTYNIYYRRTRDAMSWGTVGDDFYYLEEVPWTMYFDEGRALHGAYWHDGFGYRRSHGCVNLTITDAHWLYNWVAEDFDTVNSPDIEEGPNVYVYSSGVYR